MFLPFWCHAQVWTPSTDFPGSARDDATHFVIGDTAFCGSGLQTGWTATADFYAFEMSTESWSPIESLPSGEERQYACGWSYNNFGFVFGGATAGNYKNDLWQYDPVLDQWSVLSNLPDVGRSGAMSFTIGDSAYVVGGQTNTSDAVSQVWRYDFASDSWEQKADLPFGGRWRSAVAVQNDTAYLLGGRNENGFFPDTLYRYIPTTDSWEFESELPFAGQTYAKMVEMNDKLVVCFGLDSLNQSSDELCHYDLQLKTWHQSTSLPSSGRRGGLAFANQNILFYTTGIDENNIRIKETLKIDHPTSVPELENSGTIQFFPNPCQTNFNLSIPQNFMGGLIQVISVQGKLMYRENITTLNTSIQVEDWSKGIYILNVYDQSSGVFESAKFGVN